ncbi:transcriptional regulator BetI [Chelatococcus sambhunathii]|uniref:HTH-type transcriptional regulator BetI n=1 Tax=Chelatococcus sambhunathii TaxID=363953 RepID=A0ABU1DDT1_9HYPH|nr:transcriptional regulator BetI [Chelatococcus sambhunathii]MDR4306216.1 transcriptional regulator BetI [Chelatococcus sambhunathii]
MRSFEAERRRHLIEATIETVGDVGFKAASLGEIARRAGVSPGLFAHYFGDKDGLLEATLRFMATRLARATATRMRAARSPIERVLAVPESTLAPEEFDRRTSAVWLAFWGQIMHSEPYRRVQAIYLRRMRSNLRHALRELVPPHRLELTVSTIAATIDGLWLQSHASLETRGDGAEARAAVRELVMWLIGPGGGAQASPSAPTARRAWAATNGRGSPIWRAAERLERAEALRRAAELVRRERRALARFEARDTLRPLADIEAHDLPLVVRALERAAERAGEPQPERVRLGSRCYGVELRDTAVAVAAGVHWSAALLSASRVAAPALAAGSSILICSAARKARAIDRLGEILVEAGVAADAFAAAAGEDAERAMRIHAPELAGWERPPPKSAVFVAEDADVPAAAVALLRGPRAWARGRALSETIVFVASPARRALVERLRIEIRSLELGDPTDPACDVGPLPDREALDRALSAIAEAGRVGAALKAGGRTHEFGRGRACHLRPTLLDAVDETMAVAQAPLFAPIVSVCEVADETQAAARLRAFGPKLSLGVFAMEAGRALRFAADAGASVSWINGGAAHTDWGARDVDGFETVRRAIVSEA